MDDPEVHKTGVEFAKLVFAHLYGRAPAEDQPSDLVVQSEAFGYEKPAGEPEPNL
jgi:hypothetical protein